MNVLGFGFFAHQDDALPAMPLLFGTIGIEHGVPGCRTG